MVIGLTGGSGGGKSTVSAAFEKYGFRIADADKIAHSVMAVGSKCLAEVTDYFGTEFLNSDGSLNRKKLGGVVFSDAEKLSVLNGISHKYITEEIKKIISGGDNTVIDAAVLFESGINSMCDAVIYVHCPEDVRIKRIMSRDNISREYAQKRISAQADEDKYRKLCDFTVVNDGERDISGQIEEILNCLKK